MDLILQSAKAFITPIAGVVIVVLSAAGITPQMTVEQAVTMVVGSVVAGFVVWATPNKKAGK